MLIRPATEADAPALGPVMVDTYMAAHKGQVPDEAWQRRKQAWSYEISANAFARDIRNIANGSDPQSCIFVAVDDGREEIMGLIVGGEGDNALLPNCGEINALYVRTEHHGRGVGRRLLEAAVRFFVVQGKTALMIGSLNTNTPAAGFYSAMGGRIIGTRDGDEYGFKITEDIYGWEDLSRFPLD
jgi:ribosomal protein S18 acetylase RimI-like enzyme